MNRVFRPVSNRKQRVACCHPLFLLLLFFALPVQAATERVMPSTAAAATQVGLGLLVVLLLMFGLAWLARRLRLVPGALGSGEGMKVLAVLPLGQRERLMLVEVGQEQLLLGVTSQQVTLLHRLEQPLVVAPGREAPFARMLAEWKTKHRQQPADAQEKKNDEAG